MCFCCVSQKADADEIKTLKNSTQIRAFRTPPDAKCEFLQLTLSKNGSMKNEDCSIQMWSRSIPEEKLQGLYDALRYKSQPYKRKKNL